MKSNKSIENKSFTSINEKADQILENQEEILKELKNSNQKTHLFIGDVHSIDPTSFNEILALIGGVMFLTSTLRVKFRFPRSKYLKWGLTKKITTFNGLISYSGFALKNAVKIFAIIAGILLGLITIFNFTDDFIFNGVASLISLITLVLGIFLYQYLLACCHDIVVYHFVDPKTYEIKDVVFDNLDITFQRYFYTKEECLKIYPFFDYYFNKEEAK